ncbi:MAG: hypothetical protein LBP65_03150 [Puniceicoccales bacterium]|jgi:DNA polymerase-1|nr:hypothetical protein [Puniceicoccales bacterium]
MVSHAGAVRRSGLETEGCGTELLLIDGHNLAFRSFHGVAPLSNGDGFPTNAIHGWINSFWRLEDAIRPRRMAVIFDLGGSTFRREIYPAYKGNRRPMPEDMRQQLPALRRVTELLGAVAIEREGVEADDVLASLAVREAKDGGTVAIASSDKDFAQLVSERIALWCPPGAATSSWQPMDVLAKFGVEPRQMVAYLSLVGDSSDNIPGVAGVGAKTAARWLQLYGTLEEILLHRAELSPRLAANLERAEEILLRNQRLIRFDLSQGEDWQIPPLAPRPDELDQFLHTFELRSLARAAVGRYRGMKTTQASLF